MGALGRSALLPLTPEQRPTTPSWQLPAALPPEAPGACALDGLGLAEPLLALLRRRGYATAEAVQALLDPPAAPDPAEHFPHLAIAVERLRRACRQGEALAICGDYDADGMTSTALLVGVLGHLGAKPRAAIPSRLDDGYGLNPGMVERLAGEGIALLVTVDNGIAAREALERAQQLGVEVIVTDHHTLPPQLPPLLALLHPATTPEGSPYRGLAGVGLAYVLARALAQQQRSKRALAMALDLFCIGTIADMAPLQGVNRRWLLDGLPRLKTSPLPGLQALQQLAGLDEAPLDAGAVGFQIAPRINAVGRLGDPQLVVELLTTDEPQRALELAHACEQLNRQRRELCDAIEAEARALVEADGQQRSPFLLLAQGHWHHGVIGIVAARLVEHFGLPVALLASEGEGRLRASVRAPQGFAVDAALAACDDLLERHGGHPAAGGFTVRAERVAALHERLNQRAQAWLQSDASLRAVRPEAHVPLSALDRNFWGQVQRLEPFGIAHPTPLFWSSYCSVEQQRQLRGGHLQLTLRQGDTSLRAIAWRWGGSWTLPKEVDVAFHLRLNRWQGEERLQLELVDLRPSCSDSLVLRRRDRRYWVSRQQDHLVIRNADGEELRARCGPGRLEVEHPDGEHPYVRALFADAATALGLAA
ncbi:MAG: single-stranded-DNA-specific exonuclease RecJ [Cyanobacteria bacterium M_DeepCast_200m_mx_001]|nr:single-stranded-DNA-specific exonuclease RecJ [Cyanobacteria bacterium M_DeepCast_200m_mx_001]